jgi:SAM-dependent methyltransferase
MGGPEAHWDAVWTDRDPTEVGWYRPSLTRSFALVTAVAPDRAARIVDVGGGASTLVDALLDAGYGHLTVLDVSDAGLAHARRRLGERAAAVTWVHADAREARFDEPFAVWHDRAVFHFQTDPADRDRYVDAMAGAVAPGGHAVVATWRPGAPERCSGLPVVRYDAATLAAALGTRFREVAVEVEDHVTPSGAVHPYLYGVFERVGGPR